MSYLKSVAFLCPDTTVMIWEYEPGDWFFGFPCQNFIGMDSIYWATMFGYGGA